MNVDKLKEARKKVEKAQEQLDKVKSDAKKEYHSAVAKARKELESLQDEYAQVTKETKEELEKAGIKVVEDDVVVRRTYIYPDIHPDLRDFMELSRPVWIAPLWDKFNYPTHPPYRQTHDKWYSSSNNSIKNPSNQSITYYSN